MIRLSAFLFLLAFSLAAGPASGGAATARPDTLGSPASSRWGAIPARADSTAAVLGDRPRPGWEKAALVPYHVVGIPFRILDFVAHGTLKTADGLGLFDAPAAEHVGLKLPLDLYLMPEFGISGLEGTTYGFNLSRYQLFGPHNEIFLTASSSTRKAVKLGGGYAEVPLTKYYGLGPASDRDDRSYYNRESWWVGLESDYSLVGPLDLEFRTFTSRVAASEPEYEKNRSVGAIHQGELPPGYPGYSQGWTWRLGLVDDSTDESGRPQRGGFHKASVAYFHAVDGTDLRFLTYTLDFQRFFPLWHTKRALGLRAFFNRIDNRGDQEVPLTRLVTFSRPDELRGFSDLRFYGLGSLGFSAEYRWPVWVSRGREGPGLDAYLFSDVGQVYMGSEEISWENLAVTGGVGFRFIGGSRDFMGRFELGFSEEETVVTLKFSQNFQYDTKGMLGGKDPTRRR
jgi:hypothetical protein